MVGPLHRKLARDLRELLGPILTIGIVVACGVSAFVCLTGTYRALVGARDVYYADYRMADVFASAKRAPLHVLDQLGAIPGVRRLESRVTASIRVPMEGMDSPADGIAISIPDSGSARLGALRLTEGRMPRLGHDDEAVLLDAFARAHQLVPGASLRIVIDGQQRTIRAVGFVTSPEWVIAMVPGSIAPDDARYAVVWMRRSALAAITGLEGAFNDLAIEVQPHVRHVSVISQVDRLLADYGGVGAYSVERHPSNYYLTQELVQLQGMSNFVPTLFLSVAAFLLNVVLARIVTLQRDVIATLKALGYTDFAIALHYLELVLVIVLIGATLGLALGAWLGHAMTELYLGYYHLPHLAFSMPTDVAAIAVLTSLAAGMVGGLGAVRAVLRLTPSEAMQPPAPANYGTAGSLSPAMRKLISPSLRMVYRELIRQPARSALSVLGIGMAVGLLVLGASMSNAMTSLLTDYLPSVQREDLTVTLRAPVPSRVTHSFAAIDGVRAVGALRMLSVRFESESHARNASIVAYPTRHALRPLRALDGHIVEVPTHGVILTDILAQRLGVVPGGHVRVVILEGERMTLTIPVVGVVSEAMGMAGHMDLDELHRLLGEPASVNQILLDLDPLYAATVRRRIDDMPAVASAGSVKANLRDFANQSGEMTLVFALIVGAFAAAITIGVVYNNARVTLNARQRDLASMRILGFTKGEISSVLLGEMTVQVACALPLGLWLGKRMLDGMMADVDPETFRMPVAIHADSYAIASIVTILAAAGAALVVRRRLDSLDLIGVLKTRE